MPPGSVDSHVHLSKPVNEGRTQEGVVKVQSQRPLIKGPLLALELSCRQAGWGRRRSFQQNGAHIKIIGDCDLRIVAVVGRGIFAKRGRRCRFACGGICGRGLRSDKRYSAGAGQSGRHRKCRQRSERSRQRGEINDAIITGYKFAWHCKFQWRLRDVRNSLRDSHEIIHHIGNGWREGHRPEYIDDRRRGSRCARPRGRQEDQKHLQGLLGHHNHQTQMPPLRMAAFFLGAAKVIGFPSGAGFAARPKLGCGSIRKAFHAQFHHAVTLHRGGRTRHGRNLASAGHTGGARYSAQRRQCDGCCHWRCSPAGRGRTADDRDRRRLFRTVFAERRRACRAERFGSNAGQNRSRQGNGDRHEGHSADRR